MGDMRGGVGVMRWASQTQLSCRSKDKAHGSGDARYDIRLLHHSVTLQRHSLM